MCLNPKQAILISGLRNRGKSGTAKSLKNMFRLTGRQAAVNLKNGFRVYIYENSLEEARRHISAVIRRLETCDVLVLTCWSPDQPENQYEELNNALRGAGCSICVYELEYKEPGQRQEYHGQIASRVFKVIQSLVP